MLDDRIVNLPVVYFSYYRCDTLKLQQIKSGTHWSDSECGPQISPIATLIFAVVVGVLAVIAAVTTAAIMKRRRKKHRRSFNS
jgi:ABC-type Fe3+ transport system permease subunit